MVLFPFVDVLFTIIIAAEFYQIPFLYLLLEYGYLLYCIITMDYIDRLEYWPRINHI